MFKYPPSYTKGLQRKELNHFGQPTTSLTMGVLRKLFKKLTPTRALVMSSGKFEKLFFGEVYRVTYLAGRYTTSVV